MGWFFINNFFDMRDTKIKMTASSSPCQAASKHVLFDIERSIWKFDLRSGQVKVRSRSDHDPSRSLCTFSEAARRAKSFGTIFASLFSSCRDLLAKKTDCDVIWTQVTSSWPQIVGCTQICTDGVSGHDTERIGWFRSVYAKREAFSCFPIGL